MTTHTPVQVGQLIEQLGQARDNGDTTTDEAVAAIVAADPTLNPAGALAQLNSWKGAAQRYAVAAAVRAGTVTPGPGWGRVDARTLTARSPFVIRAYRGGAA